MRRARGAQPVAGRYLLLDEIDSGGMSAVWRAWDLRERRYVAAKVLAREHGGLLLRFVQEQSIRVRHPHVLAPYAWAADEDRRAVRDGPGPRRDRRDPAARHGRGLPPAIVADLLGQLAGRRWRAVHAAGVVHRDVKPGNLLLEATGAARPHLRLADFGVAARLDGPRLTREPGVVGTDGYVAPEAAGRGVARAEPGPVRRRGRGGRAGHRLQRVREDAVPALGEGPLADLVRALAAPRPGAPAGHAVPALDRVRALAVPRSAGRGPLVADRLGPDPSCRPVDWVRLLAVAGFAVALVARGRRPGWPGGSPR